MKTILLAVFYLLIFVSTSHAYSQNQDDPDLRDLVVEQISDYAKSLYERKNYREAQRAYAHILRLDPQNPQALSYSKKLASMVADDVLYEDGHSAMPDFSTPVYVPLGGIEQEIASEQQAMEKLRKEISQLRTSGV